MYLKGKKIFISAAGAGMGFSVAKIALNSGAEVYATDLEPTGLQKLSALGAQTETLDVTKMVQFKITFQKHRILMELLTWPAGFTTELS